MSRDAAVGGRGPAAEEMDQPTLVWQKADGSTVDIPIPPDEPVTLGRDASNMVVLQSTFVSKRHATVGIEGGQFVVRDLKSANGTRVNGETATLTPLSPGDVIEVGDQTLTFVDRGTPRGRTGAGAEAAGSAAREGGQPPRMRRRPPPREQPAPEPPRAAERSPPAHHPKVRVRP